MALPPQLSALPDGQSGLGDIQLNIVKLTEQAKFSFSLLDFRYFIGDADEKLQYSNNCSLSSKTPSQSIL